MWVAVNASASHNTHFAQNKLLQLTWVLIVVGVFIKFTVQTLNAHLWERFTDQQSRHDLCSSKYQGKCDYVNALYTNNYNVKQIPSQHDIDPLYGNNPQSLGLNGMYFQFDFIWVRQSTCCHLQGSNYTDGIKFQTFSKSFGL